MTAGVGRAVTQARGCLDVNNAERLALRHQMVQSTERTAKPVMNSSIDTPRTPTNCHVDPLRAQRQHSDR